VAADADVAHTFVVHHPKGRLPADGFAKKTAQFTTVSSCTIACRATRRSASWAITSSAGESSKPSWTSPWCPRTSTGLHSAWAARRPAARLPAPPACSRPAFTPTASATPVWPHGQAI